MSKRSAPSKIIEDKIPKKPRPAGLVDLSTKLVIPKDGSKIIKQKIKFVNKGFTAGAANLSFLWFSKINNNGEEEESYTRHFNNEVKTSLNDRKSENKFAQDFGINDLLPRRGTDGKPKHQRPGSTFYHMCYVHIFETTDENTGQRRKEWADKIVHELNQEGENRLYFKYPTQFVYAGDLPPFPTTTVNKYLTDEDSAIILKTLFFNNDVTVEEILHSVQITQFFDKPQLEQKIFLQVCGLPDDYDE